MSRQHLIAFIFIILFLIKRALKSIEKYFKNIKLKSSILKKCGILLLKFTRKFKCNYITVQSFTVRV